MSKASVFVDGRWCDEDDCRDQTGLEVGDDGSHVGGVVCERDMLFDTAINNRNK